MNIEIIIRDKIARLVDTDKYFVCGNNNIDINFIFDEEWNAHETKTARFAFNGEHIDVIFTGNTVKAPIIRDAHLVDIGVFAGNLSTTTPATMRAKRSILCNSGSPAAPTPDVYAQLMARLNEIEENGGISGEDGKDGVSVTHEWEGTVLHVTSASGTTSADLKGKKGDPGEPGTAANVTAENIKDALGYTPAKDADVSKLSEEKVDKTGASLGIASDGLIYLFVDGVPTGTGIPQGQSGDVFGYVDENNTIVLTGNLADGTYSLKYEMENGDIVNIGDMVLDSNVYYSVTSNLTNCTNNNSEKSVVEGGSYSATISANSGYELSSIVVTMGGTDITSSAVSGGTINIASVTGDIVITATAVEDVPAYTNLAKNFSVGRFKSTGAIDTSTTDGTVCEDYIPFTPGTIVRVKGFGALTDYNSVYYQSNVNSGVVYPGLANNTQSGSYTTYSYDSATGIVTLTSVRSDFAYARFSGKLTGTTADVIITVNEEIA